MSRITHCAILALLIINATFSTHAMDTSKKEDSRCCTRAIMIGTALVTGSLCATLGFGTHLEIVNHVRSEQNPCLAVWGTNPKLGTFSIQPSLCDYQYDISRLTNLIDDEFGDGTRYAKGWLRAKLPRS